MESYIDSIRARLYSLYLAGKPPALQSAAKRESWWRHVPLPLFNVATAPSSPTNDSFMLFLTNSNTASAYSLSDFLNAPSSFASAIISGASDSQKWVGLRYLSLDLLYGMPSSYSGILYGSSCVFIFFRYFFAALLAFIINIGCFIKAFKSAGTVRITILNIFQGIM